MNRMRHLSDWTWLAAEGIAIGLAASYASKMTQTLDILFDAAAGACGSFLVGWFIAPLTASGSMLGASSLLVAALGAVFLVGVSKLVRR